MMSGLARIGLIVVVAAVIATMSIPHAVARPRPTGGKRFTANKTFGLGVMVGAPSGLSGKYFLGANTAFDFGVGIISHYRHRHGNIHAHADFLWHPVSLVSARAFELPLYFGLGARIWDFRDDDDVDGFGLGARVPLGVAFDFNNVPLDVFIELAVVIDLFFDYRDDYAGDVNGAVGIRYYF